MIAYLNEWSLESTDDVVCNWGKIIDFQEMIEDFSIKCGLEIRAPKNLWDIPFSGYDLKSSHPILPNGTTVPNEKIQFLQSIYRRIHPCVENCLPFFSENEDMSSPSSSLGNAVRDERPVLSLSYNLRYATDSIHGWFKLSDESPCTKDVANIFMRKSSNYELLVDLTRVPRLNPLETPLWNGDLAEELLKGVDFINVDSKSRQGMLVKYGKKVAEINGWRYNQKVSSLNKNSGQLRYIFDSSNFTQYDIAYLSIDMEGPDLAFELCDKRGNHLGEYHWKGKSHKPAKEKHGIRVK